MIKKKQYRIYLGREKVKLNFINGIKNAIDFRFG
jgi:hypothetical protein